MGESYMGVGVYAIPVASQCMFNDTYKEVQ